MEFFKLDLFISWIPEILLDLPFYGEVDLRPWVAATVLFIGLTVFFKLIQFGLLRFLKRISRKTSTDIDDHFIDTISGVRTWVYTLISLYFVSTLFSIPDSIEKVWLALIYTVVAWQMIEIALSFITFGTQRLIEKDEDNDGQIDPGSAATSSLIRLIARIVLWSFGVIFVLSNLGIEVTSLIAGLGIGGIAIAFALQGVLSDLFASFSIYFDKPFRVGDYVVLGTDSGIVETIGIKSTRIRTMQGEELVVSNAELTTVRVRNFKMMQERRIIFNFGITYETPAAKVKEVNKIVEDIFSSIDEVRLDRAHFISLGDSALTFEVVYYVKSSGYDVYLNSQQTVNQELLERFEKKGIDFAYPTQTVYHKAMSK